MNAENCPDRIAAENPSDADVTDRGTRFNNTERRIREGFLDYIRNTPLSDMSIVGLCNLAQVSRNTFYEHHQNLLSVADGCVRDLVAMTDAMPSQAEYPGWRGERRGIPLCLLLRRDRRYAAMMFDPALSERCVNLMLELSMPSTVGPLVDSTFAKEESLKVVCNSSFRGCLQSIREGLDKSDEEWVRIKEAIDRYNNGGLRLICLG